MKSVYVQIILFLAVIIAIVLLLSTCSTQNTGVLQREVVIQELKVSRMVAYDIKSAIEDIRNILKKDELKGSDYWCQMVGLGMSICKRYDSTAPTIKPEKKTLNQFDIDGNKNNTLK